MTSKKYLSPALKSSSVSNEVGFLGRVGKENFNILFV
jgi:hypothetical protein